MGEGPRRVRNSFGVKKDEKNTLHQQGAGKQIFVEYPLGCIHILALYSLSPGHQVRLAGLSHFSRQGSSKRWRAGTHHQSRDK